MLILLNILRWFAIILDWIIKFYMIVLFARVVLSWIRVPYNQVVHMIYQVTEPVLRPIRRRMPLSLGIDFSPMIVFLLLLAIQIIVVNSLAQYIYMWTNDYYMKHPQFYKP
ncbi:YggT family protein [bacterium]|nr:YggT family protein [bacterium]